MNILTHKAYQYTMLTKIANSTARVEL